MSNSNHDIAEAIARDAARLIDEDPRTPKDRVLDPDDDCDRETLDAYIVELTKDRDDIKTVVAVRARDKLHVTMRLRQREVNIACLRETAEAGDWHPGTVGLLVRTIYTVSDNGCLDIPTVELGNIVDHVIDRCGVMTGVRPSLAPEDIVAGVTLAITGKADDTLDGFRDALSHGFKTHTFSNADDPHIRPWWTEVKLAGDILISHENLECLMTQTLRVGNEANA